MKEQATSRGWRAGVRNAFRTGMGQMVLLSGIVTLVSGILYGCLGQDVWFIIAISAGATLYHLVLRLVVGWAADRFLPQTMRWDAAWFRLRKWEVPLYRVLRVKRWKDKVPTYRPADFSLKTVPPETLLRNMCVSEIGHELNMVLGFGSLFLALFTSDPLDYLWIFALTSAIAACVDGVFVMLQRYNRPRVLRLVRRK